MWKKLVCLALCLTLCAMPAGAAGLSEGAMEEKAPMTLPCVSAMLLEPESGQIIFEVNADEKRPVASVVKIMTILLTVEAEEAGRLSLTRSRSARTRPAWAARRCCLTRARRRPWTRCSRAPS